ncbi:MAG: TRAP transporter TatT component family protein [Candidatus Bipolaricaulota bacterium]
MSRLKMCTLLILVALFVPVFGQSPAELVAQADALFQEVWLTQYTPSAAPALQAKLETAIKLYEQVLTQDPNNVSALNMLARCHYTLADVFLPEKDKADTHIKGQEYGERALRTSPEFVRVEAEKGFVEAVRVSTDVHACFWTYSNWARKVELGGAFGLVAAVLRGDDKKLMALIERCMELDRGYISGGPPRALAAYWAKHPFSKDPEKVRVLIEEAIATYPEYLENRVFYVEYYLIPAEKWTQAREELQRVIDAPIGVDALENGYAKIKALDLLGQLEGK